MLGIAAHAGPALRPEDLDHANHRAEQAHNRGQRGDGAQRGQEALQLVHCDAPGFFQGFLHHLARASHVLQPDRENAGQQGALRKAVEQVLRDSFLLDFLRHLRQQVARYDSASLQGPRALDDDAQGNNGSDDQQPDGPARCVYDVQHGVFSGRVRKKRDFKPRAAIRQPR